MSHRPVARRWGFTLIELLVVIAIIGILIGLLLPAVQKVREAANRMKCANNLKQLGLGLHNFHGSYGAFPKAGKLSNELSWHVFVLPFIEQDALYRQFSFSVGSYCGSSGTGPNKNIYAINNEIKMFICPTSPVTQMLTNAPNNVNTPEMFGTKSPYTTHYYGVMGPKGTNAATAKAYTWDNTGAQGGFARDGIFMYDTVATSTSPGPDLGYALTDVIDGTSNTLLLGEMSWANDVTGTRYRSWVRGCDGNLVCSGSRNVANSINSPSIALFNDISFGSQHPGGANFCLGDGSVRFLSENINLSTYLALASRNGGEVLGDY
jgi:prepilin-type N-terminal cleavage/methylation domain-containing protein/prepilin-type processing-associated H-X9-DG protein